MKVSFASYISEFRGKNSGIVYTKNKSGNCIRSWVMPSNPNTVRQQYARQLFSDVAPLWNSLTTTQRDGYNTYANNYYVPLDPYFLTTGYTGRQAYSALAMASSFGTGCQTQYPVTAQSWNATPASTGIAAYGTYSTPAIAPAAWNNPSLFGHNAHYANITNINR